MSAVIHTPVFPYAPGTNDFLDIFNCPEFRNTLKGFVMTLIEEDRDFRESLKVFFDYQMTISELKVSKRLAERIETITQTIENQVKYIMEEHVNPKTCLEHKAYELADHLKTNINPRNGEILEKSISLPKK